MPRVLRRVGLVVDGASERGTVTSLQPSAEDLDGAIHALTDRHEDHEANWGCWACRVIDWLEAERVARGGRP